MAMYPSLILDRLRRGGVLIGAALVCMELAQLCLSVAPGRGPAPLGAALALYGVGITCAASALARPAAPAAEPSRFEQALGLLALLVTAAMLRLLRLDSQPFVIDGDASGFAKAALDWLGPDPPPLFGTGWQSHTNLYFLLASLPIRVFGHTALGIRFAGAVGGTLAVAATFALGRALWGYRAGLLGGIVLAVLPFHLVFSRAGTEVVHLTWQAPLMILLLYRGWSGRNMAWLLAGGAVAGLSQYFYPGARILLLLAGAQVALMALDERAPARRWLAALVCTGAGALLVWGPMLPFYYRHPDAFTARLSIVNLVGSPWLEEQLLTTPAWKVALGQVLRATLPFHYPVDGPKLWYVWPQYLGPVEAALLSWGMAALWLGGEQRAWLRRYLALYVASVVVLGGALTIDTPMPSRYSVLIAPVALVIGFGIDQALRRVQLPDLASGGLLVTAVTLGVLAGGSWWLYIQHSRALETYATPSSLLASSAARALQGRSDYQLIFLRAPGAYYDAEPALPFVTGKRALELDTPVACSEHPAASGASVVIVPQAALQMGEQLHAAMPLSTWTVFRWPNGSVVGALLEIPAGAGTLCEAPHP